MRITSNVLPKEMLSVDDATNNYTFTVDLDDTEAVETQILFLIDYVNTLRKITGRTELSKNGTGNVRKRGSRKAITGVVPPLTEPPASTSFPASSGIGHGPEDAHVGVSPSS